MKRAVLIAALMLAAAGLKAQSCETIMLPYFGGDANRMANYPEEKLQWRCQYARNAFYVSDTVPVGAIVRPITDVKDRLTGVNVKEDFVVNLEELSLYAYNFEAIQLEYLSSDAVLCFSTPASSHKYLVLRSSGEIYDRTEFPEKYNK